MAWVSRDGKVIQLGMRIPLRVINIDFDKRFVDFAVAGRPTTEGTHRAPAKIAKKHAKPGKPHTKPAAKVGPQAKVAQSRYANPGKSAKPKRRGRR